jgi:class 3 adenylate cyclase
MSSLQWSEEPPVRKDEADLPEPSWPKDFRLAEIARNLAASRGGSMLCDADLNLVWVSEELKALLGEYDEDKLGYGRHVIEAYMSDTWSDTVTEETQMRMFVEGLPMMVERTPGGKKGLAETIKRANAEWSCAPKWAGEEMMADEAVDQLIDALEPVKPPPISTHLLEFIQGDLPPMQVVENHIHLHDESGEYIGCAILFEPALSARVLTMVARGDEPMFERMARLFDPGRRRAAVLFGDLQDSSVLSRRLPSGAYFKLVRAITTALDKVVIKHKGIVGKHAGDGVTAFFLSEDLGSESAACRTAIEAARDMAVAARDAVKELGEEGALLEPDECLVNVGVHWSGTLYMGQLVTGGRLEVTALGDEVNECARVQESARDGSVLATKVLIEHLTDEDAKALGVDSDAVLYRPVSWLPGATEKAKRDAGGLPVTSLS